MKLLIIGGTIFLGKSLVESALERGHDPTLFNRGQHNPDFFPEVEKLRGDRDGGLDALNDREWDAVIDTCGYFPRIVRQSAQKLANCTGHYTFISSISVYADFSTPGTREDAALGQISEEDGESADKITNENYGPLKVRCEEEVEKAFPGRNLLIRPGLIVGPFDPSDRFTYWPVRVSKGGEMLVPGSPDVRLEIIDVRDLADWTIRMIERGKTGPYSATGPNYPLTMETVLATSKKLTDSNVEPIYMDGEFLKDNEVEPSQLHTWYVPDDEPEWKYAWDIDCSKAQADGLTYRPLETTISDTLVWDSTRPTDAPRRTNLAPAKEAELVNLWKSRKLANRN